MSAWGWSAWTQNTTTFEDPAGSCRRVTLVVSLQATSTWAVHELGDRVSVTPWDAARRHHLAVGEAS